MRKLKLVRTLKVAFAALLLLVTMLPAFCMTLQAQADGLPDRSLQLFNDSAGATTTYTVSFTISTNSTIGSFDMLFCSNSPLSEESCSIPAGFDVTNVQLASQSGLTDLSLFVPATNDIVLSRTPSLISPPLTVTVKFTNVVNPSSTGFYYVRLSAYSSTNATGSPVDFGGMAFDIANNLQINSIVPPYLTFCAGLTIHDFDCSSATGDYVDFGDLTPTHTSKADSQMIVATNAANGYVIQVSGTTMTSGNNIIAAITNNDTSRLNVSQFGINLRANSNPSVGADPSGPGNGQPSANYGVPNHYQFVDSDMVASSLFADNFRKYTVSYIVNVNSQQPPGIYVSTLTYVAAGSF